MATGRDTPGYQALRRGRASERGQIYLTTFTTHHRRPLFENATFASIACRLLVEAMAPLDSRLLAWVLMPDHWHGLIELGGNERLSDVVRRIKSDSSRRLAVGMHPGARIWAEGFHDRALRHDENVVVAARYLVLNPFRAGLVRRIADYPFWDAVWARREEGVGAKAPPTVGNEPSEVTVGGIPTPTLPADKSK
jgi:REP element-mobilizing transposase RayT